MVFEIIEKRNEKATRSFYEIVMKDEKTGEILKSYTVAFKEDAELLVEEWKRKYKYVLPR